MLSDAGFDWTTLLGDDFGEFATSPNDDRFHVNDHDFTFGYDFNHAFDTSPARTHTPSNGKIPSATSVRAMGLGSSVKNISRSGIDESFGIIGDEGEEQYAEGG
jgi:hypothetical protein